jgi:hypothetical protein
MFNNAIWRIVVRKFVVAFHYACALNALDGYRLGGCIVLDKPTINLVLHDLRQNLGVGFKIETPI